MSLRKCAFSAFKCSIWNNHIFACILKILASVPYLMGGTTIVSYANHIFTETTKVAASGPSP